MTFLKAADDHGLPRIASIQNAYNLVNRSFEIGLSEIAQREERRAPARLAQDAVQSARAL